MLASFARPILAALVGTLLLAVGPSLPAHAQHRLPFAPDRPGFGHHASMVGAETIQVELGYAYNDHRDFTSHEVGQLLVRYGVNDYFEIRGHLDSYVITEDDAGYAGPGFGGKVQLYELGPSRLSAHTVVYLPTGSGPFDSVQERARQEVRLATDLRLNSLLTLSANGGTSFQFAGDAQRQWFFLPTLSVHPSNRLGFYVGHARFYSEEPTEDWVEGGLTYLLSPNTQLDTNAGWQLHEDGDRLFVGIGVARRF